MNIYLAVFCRRLNPELRIVSRITHERNVEAIHRAGADFVLSYTTLGVEAVMSLLRGYPPVLLGEGVELFSVPVPASLAGTAAADSRIGSRTGLSVVALQQGDQLTAPLTSEMLLPAGRRPADARQPRAAGRVRRGIRKGVRRFAPRLRNVSFDERCTVRTTPGLRFRATRFGDASRTLDPGMPDKLCATR